MSEKRGVLDKAKTRLEELKKESGGKFNKRADELYGWLEKVLKGEEVEEFSMRQAIMSGILEAAIDKHLVYLLLEPKLEKQISLKHRSNDSKVVTGVVYLSTNVPHVYLKQTCYSTDSIFEDLVFKPGEIEAIKRFEAFKTKKSGLTQNLEELTRDMEAAREKVRKALKIDKEEEIIL